jgi:hypothetical protein
MVRPFDRTSHLEFGLRAAATDSRGGVNSGVNSGVNYRAAHAAGMRSGASASRSMRVVDSIRVAEPIRILHVVMNTSGVE